MIGDAILNAVHRATATAVENVERKVAWTAAGGAFLLCALVSALIVAFQILQVHVGTLNAVAMVSAACVLIGLLVYLCQARWTTPSLGRQTRVLVLRR